MQDITAYGNNGVTGSPTLKAFVGYQMADWIGAEAGYTYISQASNWNNLGAPSTTVYDLAFTPGFSIPFNACYYLWSFGYRCRIT